MFKAFSCRYLFIIAICGMAHSVRAFAATQKQSISDDAVISVPFQTNGKTLEIHDKGVTGSVVPSQTQSVDGVIGQAISFDGEKDQAAKIQGEPLNLSKSMTISVWIKLTAFDRSRIQTVISRDWNWRLRIINNASALEVTYYGHPRKNHIKMLHWMGNIQTGKWYQVCYTFSQPQHTCALYVNGKKVDERPVDFLLRDEGTAPLLIGMDPGNYNPYHGAVDQLHIFDKALSSADVEKLYNTEGNGVFRQEATKWQQQIQQNHSLLSHSTDAALNTSYKDASHKLRQLENEYSAVNYWQAEAAMTKLQGSMDDYTYNQSLTKGTGKQGVSKAVSFIVQPFSDQRILPKTHIDVSQLSGDITLQGAPSETLTGSFVLRPNENVKQAMISPTELNSAKGGKTIPATAIDIRAVKVWYQAPSAWNGIHFDPSDTAKIKPVLVPELLLHDASLVKVDYAKQLNYVKLAKASGDQYADINGQQIKKFPGQIKSGAFINNPVKEFPVKDDASSLQPLDLESEQNQQFWLNVHLPDNAKPGFYHSTLNVTSASGMQGHLNLEIRVLPIDLKKPMTRYNPKKQFFHSVYYRGKLSENGEAYIGSVYKSEKQYKAEMQDLHDHGIDFVSNAISLNNEALLNESLSIQQQILGGNTLYYTGSGYNLGIGLDTSDKAFATLETRANKLKSIALKHGYTHIYVYGIDELAPDQVEKEKAVWEKLHALGIDVYVAGKEAVADQVGDVLDTLVSAGSLSDETALQMHEHGHRIFSYANPQAGPEDPKPFRVNYGIKLWKHDYDSAMTYEYQSAFGTAWNDFDAPNHYRDLTFTYPTSHGVIDTIAWEGYTQANRDVKYASYLDQMIHQGKQSDDIQKKLIAGKANKYMSDLSIDTTTNLDQVRDQIIQYILQLSK